MTPKKIPMRQCIGCRQMRPKQEMIRVVRGQDGTLSMDFKGKKNGRGAYLCPDVQCLRRAVKSKALERALEVPVPEELYTELEAQMEAKSDG